jgi:hypothetical protein
MSLTKALKHGWALSENNQQFSLNTMEDEVMFSGYDCRRLERDDSQICSLDIGTYE